MMITIDKKPLDNYFHKNEYYYKMCVCLQKKANGVLRLKIIRIIETNIHNHSGSNYQY